MNKRAVFNIIASDPDMIAYRPPLRKLTGSITSAILLQQLMWRWKVEGHQPYYKFLNPCKHEKYVVGDSWAEELGFTSSELEGALSKIATRVKKGDSLTTLFEGKNNTSMVAYAQDASKYTWWVLNEDLITEKVSQIYDDKEDIVGWQIGKRRLANLEAMVGKLPTGYTTERDTEIKNSPAESTVEEKKVPSYLPKDFHVTEEMKEWITKFGYHIEDEPMVTDDFVNYWRHGKGANKKMTRWNGVWKNRWHSLYRYGEIKKNGRFYKEKLSASEQRTAAFRAEESTDIFAHVTD